ncbi:uncharacterized protein PGRI_061930 [Penicillium griseofulvum]|uniref:Uncharacterized protein n=1 Tax=Penicillium patulum TaxID=5078 RepID=A0A135LMP4_PENPA|nr:uncharacterized protein PGRI_061930 [Penicillium griseofulvum]KXG50226.1 hypothetical protein PGRI_061930 [Penicillium griseofulvum]
MPRTTLRLNNGLKRTDANERRIWMPLRLDNLDHPQTALDRQSVLDLIRSVYDPMLITWLARPGHTWVNQFSRKHASKPFEAQVIARIGELPSAVQAIETHAVLGQILFDILKYYRLTDDAWKVPTPGAAAPPPPPPPPPPPAAPAPAPAAPAPAAPATLAPVPDSEVLAAAIALEVVTAAANLEALADAAEQVLGPGATAPVNLTPLEILAEVASSAEPSPVPSALDILANAASTRPYAALPPPAVAPAPAVSPAAGGKRGRSDSDDESELPAKKKQAVSPK